MKFISCAWTTPAVLTMNKTCTRRDWKPSHAASFRVGDEVLLMDKVPFHHGKGIAIVRITHPVIRQSTLQMPSSDWEAEGFAYLSSIGAQVNGMTPRQLWDQWLTQPHMLYVIRWEYVKLLAPAPSPHWSQDITPDLFAQARPP
jgi:hypothetical protein